MGPPLGDVEFLARSEHRLEVLDALAEQPRSRAALRALTGASSSTIGRMLHEFEDRCWIERIDHRYEATLLGAFVVEGLTTLLERMETERELRAVMRWFPTDGVDFDVVRCLSDAEIVLSTESDPMAPVRRAGRQVRGGTRLRFLTTQVTVSYFGAVKETVRRNGMTVEGIVTPAARDTLLSDTPITAVYRELHGSDDAVLSVADDVPFILQIIDDRVGLGLVDAASNPRGLILSDDGTVHEWAVDTFETCHDEARPIREL